MISTRHWRITDTPALQPMLMDLLASTAQHGADMQPTWHNVDVLLKLGLDWSRADEPTFIALDDQATVGFILWGDMGNPLSLDMQGKTCMALGTYVVPAYRRQHVALRLRQEAIELVSQKEYTRVKGAAYHDAGILSAQFAGFRATGAIMELIL